MKTCSKCGNEKPLDDFYVHSGCRDGRRPECKDCWRAKVSARRDANLETERARDRERYASNAARREAQKKTARAHYAATRERQLVLKRAYYEANREAWSIQSRKRRARLAAVEHEPYTRREIYDRDGGHCKGCEKPLVFEPNGFHIDHIIPIFHGGPDTPANVQLMCPPCNRSKWTTIPLAS